MKNWELCPKCNGTWQPYNPYLPNTSSVCDVCNGGKIINSFTGKPPKSDPIVLSNFGIISGKLTKIY